MRPLAFLVLLCCFSRSAALRGPKTVTGHVGGSLTVTCDYGAGYEGHSKWWCQGADWWSCKTLVQTDGTEQVVRGHRVTIKDDHRQRRFTVTMERLKHTDTGMYLCGIKKPEDGLRVRVEVTVSPALITTTTAATTTTTTTTTTNAPTTETTGAAADMTRARANTTSAFPTPLFLLVYSVLPLLLLAAALLAWRKLKRQRRATGVSPEPDAQEEVCYAQLSLHPRDPEPNIHPGVDPRAGRSCEVTEYSSIRKLQRAPQ